MPNVEIEILSPWRDLATLLTNKMDNVLRDEEEEGTQISKIDID